MIHAKACRYYHNCEIIPAGFYNDFSEVIIRSQRLTFLTLPGLNFLFLLLRRTMPAYIFQKTMIIQRPAVIKALITLTAKFMKHFDLFPGFHTFRHSLDMQLFAKSKN